MAHSSQKKHNIWTKIKVKLHNASLFYSMAVIPAKLLSLSSPVALNEVSQYKHHVSNIKMDFFFLTWKNILLGHTYLKCIHGYDCQSLFT